MKTFKYNLLVQILRVDVSSDGFRPCRESLKRGLGDLAGFFESLPVNMHKQFLALATPDLKTNNLNVIKLGK